MRLAYRPAVLDLRAPLETARGSMTQRESWLVRAMGLESETPVGYGEAAPLPGVGGGDPGRVVAALATFGRSLDGEGRVGGGDSGADSRRQIDQGLLYRLERSWEADLPDDAAARAGASFALADLASRRERLPLAAWLAGFDADATTDVPPSGSAASRPVRTPAKAVLVNGTIGATSPEEAAALARAMVARGYCTLKVKVGGDLDADLARVGAVRAAAGADVRLRLDANEAWTREQAAVTLQRFADYDIEYAEQPVARADVEGMALLRGRVGIAIAADEALMERGGPDAVAAAQAADVWVVKPALQGGPMRSLALARRAAGMGVKCVVTSSLDSAIGRLGALHVAAAIAGCGWDGGLAHGLATGILLRNDVVPTPEPVGGRLQVTAAAGLGCPDPDGPWIGLGANEAEWLT